MAQGILQSGAPPVEQVAPGSAPRTPTPEGEGPQYRSRVAEAIPPELRGAFRQACAAGKRIFYAEEMREEIQKQLSGNAPLWQKIGEGTAKLVMMIDQQSKKTLPQELVVPLGIELASEIADFLSEAGETMSDEDKQKAVLYTSVCIAKLYGASDEQIQSMAQGSAPPAEAPAPEEPAPTAQPMEA